MKFLRTMLSVLCFLAIGACTVICLYEAYNSYIAKEPKTVITYRHLATQDNGDFSSGYTKATEDTASSDVATTEKADVEEESVTVIPTPEEIAGGSGTQKTEIKTAEP